MKNKSALKFANCIKNCKEKKIVEDCEIEEIVQHYQMRKLIILKEK